MKRRLIFGPVLIAVLLGLLLLDQALETAAFPAWLAWANKGGGIVILALGMVAAARAGVELARMFKVMGIMAHSRHLASAAAAGVLAGSLTISAHEQTVWGVSSGAVMGTAAALVVLLSMLAYIRDKDLKGAAGAVAAAIFAFVFMGVVLGFLLAIRREYGVWVMLSVIAIVKACDSGAYFTGTAIGKHKLIPWISPGKTWEGLVGGVITGGLFAVGLLWLGHTMAPAAVERISAMTYSQAAIVGLILGAVGQAGDLSASVVKRDAGVKDAGRILPGFGGMVDMLDSLVIAAPVGFWLLRMLDGR